MGKKTSQQGGENEINSSPEPPYQQGSAKVKLICREEKEGWENKRKNEKDRKERKKDESEDVWQ